MPTLHDAVAALKKLEGDIYDNRFIHSSTEGWYVGEPAPTELIAHYRAHSRLLPPELVDLYELMNGCHLAWGFFTEPMPPAGASDEEKEQWGEEADYGEVEGRFYLPPLNELVGLRTDLENEYTFFGPGTVSLEVDQSQPEYGTWLVAYSPDPPPAPASYHPLYNATPATDAAAHATADVARARLVFVYAKVDELPIPVGLADYILQGLAYGFAWYWQRAVWGSEQGSHPFIADLEALKARLAATWELP